MKFQKLFLKSFLSLTPKAIYNSYHLMLTARTCSCSVTCEGVDPLLLSILFNSHNKAQSLWGFCSLGYRGKGNGASETELLSPGRSASRWQRWALNLGLFHSKSLPSLLTNTGRAAALPDLDFAGLLTQHLYGLVRGRGRAGYRRERDTALGNSFVAPTGWPPWGTSQRAVGWAAGRQPAPFLCVVSMSSGIPFLRERYSA